MSEINLQVSVPLPPQVTVSVARLGPENAATAEDIRAYAAPRGGELMRWADDVGAWEYRFPDGWRYKIVQLQGSEPVEGWSEPRP